MSEPVKPALSAEEWADDGGRGEFRDAQLTVRQPVGLDGLIVGQDALGEHDSVIVDDAGRGRHAIAALCLDGQPFGFRWEDVERCRTRARDYEAMNDSDPDVGFYESQQYWNGLADRIEALLRPRKDQT